MKKVVIIGAGLSGLACGYYLDKSKFDIRIFESKATPGGRVKSEKVDGYICDIGFQVLLNNYDEIKKLNLYHKLDLKYFDSGASIYQDGKILKLYNPIFHPFKFLFSNFFKIFKLKDLFAITLNFFFKKNTVYGKTSDLMNRYLSTKSRSLFFYPFFKGIFLRMGVITVGPVTIINAANKKEICQDKPKIKCAAMPAPKKVIITATVINLTITGPTFKTSPRRRVKPPSNRIILMAKDTK